MQKVFSVNYFLWFPYHSHFSDQRKEVLIKPLSVDSNPHPQQ